jgi:hypothetical protein
MENANKKAKSAAKADTSEIPLPDGIKIISEEEFEKAKSTGKKGKWQEIIQLVKTTGKSLEVTKLNGEILTEGQIGAGLRAFGRAGLRAKRVSYIQDGIKKYKILVAP